jgi:hypothetical protein
MVNPSNDNLGPGEDSPLDDDGLKVPQAPKEAAERKEKLDELSDEDFDRAIRDLCDPEKVKEAAGHLGSLKGDPWEQENAPPVNLDAIRRCVRGKLSKDEERRIRLMACKWETWHKGYFNEHAAFLQERFDEAIPPVDREAIRRYVRGELSGEELNRVTEMIHSWAKWEKAHEEEQMKLSQPPGTE